MLQRKPLLHDLVGEPGAALQLGGVGEIDLTPQVFDGLGPFQQGRPMAEPVACGLSVACAQQSRDVGAGSADDLVEAMLWQGKGKKRSVGVDMEKLVAARTVGPMGGAIEARIYAESPEKGFLPGSGFLAHLRLSLIHI